jgi:hypothetical protein
MFEGLRYLNGILVSAALLFAQSPSSTNFTLKAYDVGSGGGSGSSTNFQVDAVTGTQNGADGSSTNFELQSGFSPTRNSNVPPAPTLANPSSEYRRLRITINNGNNPSDSLFAVSISPDSFTTTYYVKSDLSIGSTLALSDYRTYTGWGSGSGQWIDGLSSSTTYTVKVKAIQGDFSESAYGPTASAATVAPSVTFGIETSATSTPPFSATFSSLTAGTVHNANEDIIGTITTNAVSGADVLIAGSNTGLNSASQSYTIASATADLASAGSGYGGQIISTSQSSGGPITSLSPFSSGGDQVGQISSSLQRLANSSVAVTSGSFTLRLKAKTLPSDPGASDYTDTLTIIATPLF